jgi:type I restriction enzyme, R subunit
MSWHGCRTQPKAWEALTKNHGTEAAEVLPARLREQFNTRGTLDVLRHGVEMIGLRQKLPLAQFKPTLAMNPEILVKYAANDQYRFDRLPKPKGLTAEPLLSFPSGALVHFAVSNDEVRMTTKLAGPATIFLPFNKGDEGAAGNPPNLNGGHRTAYLWEEVCARESWLEILGRYLVSQKDSKKQIKSVIFPRYYELDATRKLMASVFESGAGGKYLIQHSAGSGKTNSIAWSAHFLTDLHDAQHKKVFDSVLVVSDRNVIDQQLQKPSSTSSAPPESCVYGSFRDEQAGTGIR